MAIFSFFNTQKPKQFNFKPRHYDERKERIDEIISRNKEEAISDPDAMKSRIKHGFQTRGSVDRSYESNIRKRSNRTLLITMVVLVLLSFLLLSTYLPEILKLVE
ncbi:hypothetical protein [Portibacter lacus]|uniref:Riboflavin synthase subunit beta n=1 Tax=Portibacter lacus TaxID=1099794 RepID=A0AA37SNM7_9BACT|nr:hypothetical protein [Portibacter lacus]GLR17911.1 hypothetical protein GCM10007940_25260 [Portibacter lacus]